MYSLTTTLQGALPDWRVVRLSGFVRHSLAAVAVPAVMRLGIVAAVTCNLCLAHTLT